MRIALFALLAITALGCVDEPAPPGEPKPKAGKSASAGRSGSAAPSSSAPTAERVTMQPSYKSIEEEVVINVGGRKVPGTISHPDTTSKRPAVLLIAGSGPTDRDWQSKLIPGNNGSGKLLAHELTRRGVVVLRYDKLGSGASEPPTKVPITADDAEAEPRAALELLRGREDVDPNEVFVAGHSEGGIYAIRLATADGAPKIAGLMLLSSAGRSMRDIIVSQIVEAGKAQAKKANIDEKVVDEQMKPINQDLDDFFAGKEVDAKKYETSLPIIAAVLNPASAPMVRTLYAYDPVTGFAKLGKLPVLVINGRKDVQVSPTADAQRLADAAKAAGCTLTFFLGEDADHVLKYQEKSLDKLLDDPASVQANYNADVRVLDPPTLEAIVSFVHAYSP